MLRLVRTDGKLALTGTSAVNSKSQSEARWRGRGTCADPRTRPDGLCDSSRPALVKPGAKATEAELREFVAARLAAFKVPVKVAF